MQGVIQMNEQDILLDLNEKFQSASLTFGFWKDSKLPTVFVANRFCRGAVTLYGAHILSYIPAGQEDLIMVSEKSLFEAPKGIRGGIPVCWPWFGSNPAPSHGVARIQFWELKNAVSMPDGSDTLTFELTVRDPHELTVTLEANFGAALTISVTTVNNGKTAYQLGEAIHTYFKVGEIAKTQIRGLGGAQCDNRLNNQLSTAPDVFGFEAETDNVYHSEATVIIEDPVLKRKIKVEKKNSRDTVVWNPWIDKSRRMTDFGDEEYHGMVCVEAANCFDNKVDLQPGANHTLVQKISVEG